MKNLNKTNFDIFVKVKTSNFFTIIKRSACVPVKTGMSMGTRVT